MPSWVKPQSRYCAATGSSPLRMASRHAVNADGSTAATSVPPERGKQGRDSRSGRRSNGLVRRRGSAATGAADRATDRRDPAGVRVTGRVARRSSRKGGRRLAGRDDSANSGRRAGTGRRSAVGRAKRRTWATWPRGRGRRPGRPGGRRPGRAGRRRTGAATAARPPCAPPGPRSPAPLLPWSRDGPRPAGPRRPRLGRSRRRRRLQLQLLHIRSISSSTSNGLCRKSSAPASFSSWILSSSTMPEMQRMRTSSSVGVGPDAVADFLAVDVRQHDVEDDQVRAVLLDHHAGVEAVGGDADLEPAVLLEDLVDQSRRVRRRRPRAAPCACRSPGRRSGCRCPS